MVNLLTPENGNKTAKINVINFHRNLTTVVRAQNDTSKQQISTDTVSIKKVIILLQQSTCRRFAAKYLFIENGIS